MKEAIRTPNLKGANNRIFQAMNTRLQPMNFNLKLTSNRTSRSSETVEVSRPQSSLVVAKKDFFEVRPFFEN